MSVDERLARLAASIEAHSLDTDAALMEVEAAASKQNARRRVQWAVAACAAVIAVVVWGPGLVDSVSSFIGGDDIRPIDDPSEPVEQPVVVDGDWVRVDDAGLDASRGFSAVTQVDGRLIAVGATWDSVGVLTSTDGFSWTPADTPGGRGLTGVIRGGPGVIAYSAGGVLTSPDGLTWASADFPGGASEISAITVGESGLVAAGWRDSGTWADSGSCPTDRDTWPDAAVWTSADGLTWDSVTDESFGGPWRQQMNDVMETGTGLLAVGSVDAGPLDPSETRDPPPASTDPADVGERAAVWTSVDGASWVRVPHDPAVFSAAPCVTMRRVVAGGPGLVAIGAEEYPEGNGDYERRTVVWTSVDGQTWTRVPEEQHGLDGGPFGWVMRVVNIGGELIAVGLDSAGAAGMWTSVDGLTWQRVTDESFSGPTPGPMITDIIQTRTGLVSVGATDADFGTTGRPSTAVVWVLERP